jgi:hypothetical protein
VVISLLAYVDSSRIAPGQVKDLGADEAVVNNDVRFSKKARRSKGEELWITRAGADQMDHAFSGRFRTIERIEKGTTGSFLVPSESQISRRPPKDALPEGAASLEVPENPLNRAPHFPGKGGQAADTRGQKALDGRAKIHGEHRGGPSGGNRDHHLVSIYEGRSLKIGAGGFVYQINKGAGVPGPASLLATSGRVCFGNEYESGALEVPCLGGAIKRLSTVLKG